MSTSLSAFDSEADEQASLWAARLEGATLSAKDRTELEAWLAQNGLHRTLLSQYCQLSTDLEERLPQLIASGQVVLPGKAREKLVARGRTWAWILSGAMAASLVGFVVLTRIRADHSPQKFATPVAQRQSLTLPDGTQVELNARTTLLVENGPAERRVRLTEGEAYFKVSHDKSRPFIVETPAGSVRVTGTVFDVRSEALSELDVTVVEGSVQVHPSVADAMASALPVALTPGDHLLARPTGVSVEALSQGDVDDALAWREGTIVLVGTPLSEALARFAHYQGRGITVSSSVAGLKLGGRHSLDDLDGFLDYVKEAFPGVQVSRDPSGKLRVSLSTEP